MESKQIYFLKKYNEPSYHDIISSVNRYTSQICSTTKTVFTARSLVTGLVSVSVATVASIRWHVRHLYISQVAYHQIVDRYQISIARARAHSHTDTNARAHACFSLRAPVRVHPRSTTSMKSLCRHYFISEAKTALITSSRQTLQQQTTVAGHRPWNDQLWLAYCVHVRDLICSTNNAVTHVNIVLVWAVVTVSRTLVRWVFQAKTPVIIWVSGIG